MIKITAQSNVRHIALFYVISTLRHAKCGFFNFVAQSQTKKTTRAVVFFVLCFFVFLFYFDFYGWLSQGSAGARSALTAPKFCRGLIATRLVCDFEFRLQPMVIFFQQVISIFHLVVVLKYTCTERTSLDADRAVFRDMQSGFSLFGALIGNACAAFDTGMWLR